MTAWAEIENPDTGGTATVPRSSLGTYEAAGWQPVSPELKPPSPEPSPDPVPASEPGDSTPAPPDGGGTETEEATS